MRVECVWVSFPPFNFYLDSLSSTRKNPLERNSSQGRKAALRPPAWNRLRSSCLVIRVDDLDIHQVRSPGHGEAWLERGGAVPLENNSVNKVVEFGVCFPNFWVGRHLCFLLSMSVEICTWDSISFLWISYYKPYKSSMENMNLWIVLGVRMPGIRGEYV